MKYKFLALSLLATSMLYSYGQEALPLSITDREKTAFTPLNPNYQIIMEGVHCGEMNFDPQMNWYGLYEGDVKRSGELKKVEIELVLRSDLEEEQAAAVFGEDNINSDYLVRTNTKTKSLFLIGSKRPLEEIMVKGTGWCATGNSGFLFPEQKVSIFIPGYNELLITGKERIYITDSAAFSFTRKYILELKSIDPENNKETLQNLTDDIPFTGYSGEQHALYQIPRILWCGDIDNDHKLDLLIYSHQMRESGDNMGFLILFLSSESGEGIIVGKAAEWYFKVSCEG